MAWDKTDCLQSSLHKGSEEAVRSSMLGLLSPIKHHIGSHESKKMNRPITTTLIYLRILGVRKKKTTSFLCLLILPKVTPKNGYILSINHNRQKTGSMYLGDCSDPFPSQLLTCCRMVDQVGNLIKSSPHSAPRRSVLSCNPEVTQRSILSQERRVNTSFR